MSSEQQDQVHTGFIHTFSLSNGSDHMALTQGHVKPLDHEQNIPKYERNKLNYLTKKAKQD